jgi:hypothetical protein
MATGLAMLSNSLYAACIQRAALMLGGYEALGRELGISPRLLERWADRRGVPDEGVFLKVVDLVLERRFTPTQSSPAASTIYRK